MRWITAACFALLVVLWGAPAYSQGGTSDDDKATTSDSQTTDTTEGDETQSDDEQGDDQTADDDDSTADDDDDATADDDDDATAGDDDDSTTTTGDDDDATTGDDDDDQAAAMPTGGPKPTTVLAVSAGATAAGVLGGILLFPASDVLGVGLAAASAALFPSIGNVMLKEYSTAAVWLGVRVVGELLIFAGIQLIDSGAADANDATQALGIFSLFVGSVGTIGGAGADMGAAWTTAEQRTVKAHLRNSGFAMTPTRDNAGNWGVRAGWYTRF